ncbi:5-(carboxyamino)imidazole ribonucleotide synthase [Gulosibacter molinativorax]|uniref:N5-carboxyaminoimidazole ribonucleotide synthase n=1 Tax=Gulosibacter molinativorax TaxID=256821 RepID=A0ABT7C9K4_9MICO|nr:5-(carboxyamino)imidazole ribonucleotide synthase [Gulosibacter molinativorax]MDJ1371326.1 5-(carboxyamino)imidazole ribonucleotide synthase [Gulosibacter molinativorax]QUY63610.1 N5-carboxyaminoimidazole ribonucleotide synthase [Gulosibacter molinativorax]
MGVPVVGVVGGGQLARMMVPAAVELGIEIRVLAEVEGSSARLAATQVGDYRDVDTVMAFAKDVDVVTFDHEHVPQNVLRAMVDAGISVQPGPDALEFAQDKLRMRERLTELGAPVPAWAAVSNAEELQRFIDEHRGVAILKTPRGGYDGRGVRVVRSGEEGADWFQDFDRLLVEELVEFRRELAQLIARRPSGEIRVWPVAETVQRGGVCHEVIAPAPGAGSGANRFAEVATGIAESIAEGLDVTGVLAVEMFETTDSRLLVNELAMRPHNSGHWTIDGSRTSQFEQHLRAVLDLPLGDPAALDAHSVMVNILGGPQEEAITDRFAVAMEHVPDAKLHTYGKSARPGRKVGHVTVTGDDLDEVMYRARTAAGFFDDPDTETDTGTDTDTDTATETSTSTNTEETR